MPNKTNTRSTRKTGLNFLMGTSAIIQTIAETIIRKDKMIYEEVNMAAAIMQRTKTIFDRGSSWCNGELELTYSIIESPDLF